MKRIVKKLLGIMLAIVVAFSASAATTGKTSFAKRQDVQKFITMMVKDYGFNQQYLNQLFSQVQIQPAIIAGMSTTKEQLPWYKYRDIFITQERVNQGVAFWKQHQKTLNAVSQCDGVDPSVIVAILGVETYYGKHQGSYRVMDSLSTLAFDFPPRSKFFKEELKEYLLLTRENNIDPLLLKGSYAGAMGQPQFMPSSYRQYAVNFSSNDQKDLANNPDDVIASVSNYFKQHGWRTQQPIAMLAQVKGSAYKVVPFNQLKPETTLQKLQQYGILPTNQISPTAKASFLILKTSSDTQQYWLGFNNFYVITRYNPRLNYAMAVYQLSLAIKQQYTQSTQTQKTKTA